MVKTDPEMVVALADHFLHVSRLGPQGLQHSRMLGAQVVEVVGADLQQEGGGIALGVVQRAGITGIALRGGRWEGDRQEPGGVFPGERNGGRHTGGGH